MNWLTARHVAIAVALVLLATLPAWVGNPYYINVSSQILLFAVFALALNVLRLRRPSYPLGHAGLFAIAGYTAALMLEAGYGHLSANLAALVVALAASAVFAVLALRATGIGFLMITLALGQIPVGHRVSLGKPDQRRQRRQRTDPPCPFRFRAQQRAIFLLRNARGVSRGRVHDGAVRALAVWRQPSRHA